MKSSNNSCARECSHCGKGMNEGYVWGDGEGYACSVLCLFVNGYTTAKFDRDYEAGVIYYTDWEQDDKKSTEPNLEEVIKNLIIEELKA